MSKATDTQNAALYALALAAGCAAGRNLTGIAPMVVQQHANPLNDNSPVVYQEVVNDGVCGFGWVHLKGNTPFGRWAKKNGLARPDYPNGLAINSKLMTQSMARNEAFARAFAQVLNDNGVPDAYPQSRID